MTQNFRIETPNLNEIAKGFAVFGYKVARKHWRAAHQAGAIELRKHIKRAAPAASIAAAVEIAPGRPLTPLHAHRRIKVGSRIAHLFEFGFNIVKYPKYIPGIKKRFGRGTRLDKKGREIADRVAKGSLPVIGHVRAKPWLLPASENAWTSVLGKIEARMAKGLVKETLKGG